MLGLLLGEVLVALGLPLAARRLVWSDVRRALASLLVLIGCAELLPLVLLGWTFASGDRPLLSAAFLASWVVCYAAVYPHYRRAANAAGGP